MTEARGDTTTASAYRQEALRVVADIHLDKAAEIKAVPRAADNGSRRAA